MATHHGNDGRIKVGANTIAEITNWQVTQTIATADDSAAGDTWTTHNTGKRSWSGSCTAWFDDTDTNGQAALTIGASVTLNFYPEGDTTGDPEWSGTATVTSRGANAPHNGNVPININFLGDGALTEGTVS